MKKETATATPRDPGSGEGEPMETGGQGEGTESTSTEEKVDDKFVTPVNAEVRLLPSSSLVTRPPSLLSCSSHPTSP